MKMLLMSVCALLAAPNNLPDNNAHPRAQIACPNWINDGNAVAPAGVRVSPAQARTNRLRCYCSIVKPLEKTCKKKYPGNLCEQRTLNWVDRNFSLPGGVLNANQRQNQTYPAENLIINIRSSY